MRPSDRTLRRWLRTGRPRRVERMVGRADVADRLDALTRLRSEEVAALSGVLAPQDGFEQRVAGGIRRQLDSEVVDLLVDLCGLGWHTATTLLAPEPDRPEE